MFPTLKKGEGEVTFHEGRKENLHLGKKVGNFHVSQQLLSMIVGCCETKNPRKLLRPEANIL